MNRLRVQLLDGRSGTVLAAEVHFDTGGIGWVADREIAAPPPTPDEARQRLIDAMALPEGDHEGWLEIAERKLYAERARDNPFRRQWDVSTLGARMRTARHVCGMGLAQAAIRMRCNPQSLSQWERGLRNVPAQKLQTIAPVLGVKLRWLLGETEDGGPGLPREQLRKRVTHNWRRRQDLLRKRCQARKEAARLNKVYARVKAKAAEKPSTPVAE